MNRAIRITTTLFTISWTVLIIWNVLLFSFHIFRENPLHLLFLNTVVVLGLFGWLIFSRRISPLAVYDITLKTALYVIVVLWGLVSLIVAGAGIYRLVYPDIKSISRSDLVDYGIITLAGVGVCTVILVLRNFIKRKQIAAAGS